ncbi:MAG: hypothetical protein HWE25_03695 [Alphaproteobacteria bacterium]|nr:hypothetical protein [Alphaproteobacteria bacterium]
MAPDILQMLAEGDRKEVARSGDVAVAAAESPETLALVVAALFHDEPAVVSHAAHALMTVAKKNAPLLNPHREALARAYGEEQWELKEQMAKILPQLSFRESEQGRLMEEFDATLRTHKSGIARTCALQAMVDIAAQNNAHAAMARQGLDYAQGHTSKALQARARKLGPLLD